MLNGSYEKNGVITKETDIKLKYSSDSRKFEFLSIN